MRRKRRRPGSPVPPAVGGCIMPWRTSPTQLRDRLLIRRGVSLPVLQDLVQRSGADAVYWNRLYEPAAIRRDTEVKQALRAAAIAAESGNAALLFEPWEVKNRQGGPFRVFTPFWKRLQEAGLPQARDAHRSALADRRPDDIRGYRAVCAGKPEAPSQYPMGFGIYAAWQPTRAAAEARLEEFLATEVRHYAQGRDLPARDQVSRLSPYLHFGQLGPREVVRACRRERQTAAEFLRELGWREFAHHLLFHFPHTARRHWTRAFAAFPWRDDAAAPAGLAARRDRYPAGRCRHAPTVADRLDAQPGAHDRRLVPDQESAAALAGRVRAGSGTPWSMPIWPATPWAGSGPPVAVPMRRPISGCSIRSCRVRSSIRTAAMCGAGCLSSLACRPSGSIGPGTRPTRCCAEAGVALGEDYPHPIVDLKASTATRAGCLGDGEMRPSPCGVKPGDGAAGGFRPCLGPCPRAWLRGGVLACSS